MHVFYFTIIILIIQDDIPDNNERCIELIDEMTNYYTDNNEVVKFLVKYYGRRLYNPNYRIIFFEIM